MDDYLIMKSLFFLTNVDMLGRFFSQVANANSSCMQCCKKMQLYNCDILSRWLLVCWILKLCLFIFYFFLGLETFSYFFSRSLSCSFSLWVAFSLFLKNEKTQNYYFVVHTKTITCFLGNASFNRSF